MFKKDKYIINKSTVNNISNNEDTIVNENKKKWRFLTVEYDRIRSRRFV